MNSALRPMSTGEVLDRTFYLYRNNFVLFAGISMVAYLLALVVSLAMLGIFGPETVQGRTFAVNPVTFLMINGVNMVTYLIVHSLASGATVHAVSLVHLGRAGSISQSYSGIKPIFFRILRIVISVLIRAGGPFVIAYALFLLAVTSVGRSRNAPSMMIMLALAMVVLLVALIVGLVWMVRVFCRYAFAVPACALEGVSARDALKRSKFLTKGSLSRLFLVGLLTGLIGFALTNVFQLPIFIANHTWITGRAYFSVLSLAAIHFADFAAKTLAGPIATIAIALLYYDERIKKEAFDLQWMMQSLDPSAGQAITATSSGAGVAM